MDETREMARFIVVCTIMLASAEFLTRRTAATLRWVLLVVVWLVVVAMLFWVLGVSDGAVCQAPNLC
jgi:hypothetical protein